MYCFGNFLKSASIIVTDIVNLPRIMRRYGNFVLFQAFIRYNRMIPVSSILAIAVTIINVLLAKLDMAVNAAVPSIDPLARHIAKFHARHGLYWPLLLFYRYHRVSGN